MGVYVYSLSNYVKAIEFRYKENHQPIALLHARDNIAPGQALTLRGILAANNMQFAAVVVDGEPMLQVSGFKDSDDFLGVLKKHEIIQDEPQISHTKSPRPERETLGGKIKNMLRRSSLKLAGWLNLIGDLGFLASGVKDNDRVKTTGGALYTLGAANLARYGNIEDGHELKTVSENIATIIHNEAGGIAEESSLSNSLRNKRGGMVAKVDDFLYENPSDVTLLSYTAGAAAMLVSGVKKMLNGEGWAAAGYGITSLSLKITSLLIPEKIKNQGDVEADTEKAPAGNPLSRFIDWIREKPLRLFGYGSFATDTLLGLDAYQQYRRNPKGSGHIYTAITTCSYLLADIMVAISSKNKSNVTGKFSRDEQRGIEALAAEAITPLAREKQEVVITKIASYLGKHKGSTRNAEQISGSIRQQLTANEKNPWLPPLTPKKMQTHESNFHKELEYATSLQVCS